MFNMLFDPSNNWPYSIPDLRTRIRYLLLCIKHSDIKYVYNKYLYTNCDINDLVKMFSQLISDEIDRDIVETLLN